MHIIANTYLDRRNGAAVLYVNKVSIYFSDGKPIAIATHGESIASIAFHILDTDDTLKVRRIKKILGPYSYAIASKLSQERLQELMVEYVAKQFSNEIDAILTEKGQNYGN